VGGFCNVCKTNYGKDMSTARDRILLIVGACGVLAALALADWALVNTRIAPAWRDYLLYNTCLWIAMFVAMRGRINSIHFRNLFCSVLIFHWFLSAVFTHRGFSWLWTGALAIIELSFLNKRKRTLTGLTE
jgi:hypothetical protein